jgi:palmitoyltransferase
MAGLNDAPIFQALAIPAVCLLILFLAYSSQYLFHTAENLDPGPPSSRLTIIFNVLLGLLWITYYRACTVHPGQYRHSAEFVRGFRGGKEQDDEREDSDKECKACERVTDSEDDTFEQRQNRVKEPDGEAVAAKYPPGTRWCRKCLAPKPPRAHHCRVCKTCVPRMDHHCPWTANCVSLTTFPHFLRFLICTNLSLWILGYLLYQRFAALWSQRHLPSYLGPSLGSLIHLTLLSLVCFFTSLAVGILLATATKNWLFNMTTIETWELEKHKSRFETGKDWFADDEGAKVPLDKIEFPYDVGFFENLAQGMGTRNVLLWFFPFSPTPKLGKDGQGVGWQYEENGFNDRAGMWPPDPDRRRSSRWPALRQDPEDMVLPQYASIEEEKEAFRRRQEADMQRWNHGPRVIELSDDDQPPLPRQEPSVSTRWKAQRQRILAELEEVEDYDLLNEYETPTGRPRKPFTNADGERLRDFGVDEDTEEEERIPLAPGVNDDEDVPLGELLRLRRRKGAETVEDVMR